MPAPARPPPTFRPLFGCGQRERKRNYDVNEYYRSALSGGDGPAPKEKVPKQRKGPAMHDFQFFQKQRLETLLQREHDLNVQVRGG